MRFIKNGPAIPHELLVARDEGQVVFFCGAGVSCARAGMPTFFELAERVTEYLGVAPNNPANKVIKEMRETYNRTKIEGLISADRVFGFLERDFFEKDIQAAVTKSLMPQSSPDLSAHQTLIKLATTPEGMVQIITTNFDKLFNEAKPGINTYIPPNLPNTSIANEFNGIVYLHGKINKQGNGAEGENFVLSSSEFGRAYISDGWATAFVKTILQQYHVVFIGYSADDPPIQYLLEALHKNIAPRKDIYAFQSGDNEYANSRWQHKGVKAIAYPSENFHAALWDTLDAWAEKVEAPEKWMSNIIEKAKKGPEKLQPYERAQVAYLVSTVEGARRFSQADFPPPASWVNVFDPRQRYETPDWRKYSPQEEIIDPFILYSIDSDPIPSQLDVTNPNAKRNVPSNVWNAFDLTPTDQFDIENSKTFYIYGEYARNHARLPVRIKYLANWLGNVVMQPDALAWSTRHKILHPDIQDSLEQGLRRLRGNIPTPLLEAWGYLFDYWETYDISEEYQLQFFAKKMMFETWNNLNLRKFSKFSAPAISIERVYTKNMLSENSMTDFRNFMSLDVTYPAIPNIIDIPDDKLAAFITILRKNLEKAVALEQEVGGYGLYNLASIISKDEDINQHKEDTYNKYDGISSWMLFYIDNMKRLMLYDIKLARHEISKWPSDDDTIFAKLLVWALGQPELVTRNNFIRFLNKLSNTTFWNRYHAHDLLWTLSLRWRDLSDLTRRKIEDRIIVGPKLEDYVDEKQSKMWWAVQILERLWWLIGQGHTIQNDIEKLTTQLKVYAPKWDIELTAHAATSYKSQSGWVEEVDDYSELKDLPADEIIKKSMQLSGWGIVELKRKTPFKGLAHKRPIKALTALLIETKRGDFPEREWVTFLNRFCEKNEKPKVTIIIASRLIELDNEYYIKLSPYIAGWIENSSNILASNTPKLLFGLISKYTKASSNTNINTNENFISINIEKYKQVDWLKEAYNSPTGKITKALFNDSYINEIIENNELTKDWQVLASNLLALPGNLYRHSLSIFSQHLGWLYEIDSNWTLKNILSPLDSNDEHNHYAIWSGTFNAHQTFSPNLVTYLIPYIIKLIKSSDYPFTPYRKNIASFILSTWEYSKDSSNKNKLISNEDLRDLLLQANDEFRCQVLIKAQSWLRTNEERGLLIISEILNNVWPLQIIARSNAVLTTIFSLLSSNTSAFPQLVKIILPFLSPVTSDNRKIISFAHLYGELAKLYPDDVLSILDIVLLDDVNTWPYGIDMVIKKLSENDHIQSDKRFLNLKKKWNSHHTY